eukprot:scaffold159469_cov38-Tisochrysis_lutea.AAC.2
MTWLTATTATRVEESAGAKQRDARAWANSSSTSGLAMAGDYLVTRTLRYKEGCVQEERDDGSTHRHSHSSKCVRKSIHRLRTPAGARADVLIQVL